MSKTIKDIIDQLEYGINDVFDCPGGHRLDQYDKDQALKELEAIMQGVIGEKIRPIINGRQPEKGEEVTIDLENNRNESCIFIQENGKRTLQEEQLKRLDAALYGKESK